MHDPFFLVPLTPTGFNITRTYHGVAETTFTIGWDPIPQGSGPEAIVDNYTIYISSPAFGPVIIMTDSPPLNITLTHNVRYSVSITASNCARESDNLPLLDIKISK